MEFPVLNKTDACIWCKKGKMLEPHSFASINAGAILLDPDDPECGGPSEQMEGYLNLSWHGAHSNESGEGMLPDTFANLTIAKDNKGGQSDFLFCSTNCLRAFLNHCVDELEKRIK